MTLRSTPWLALLTASLCLSAHAALKPAEQLLPDDTLAVFTFPELTKTSASYQQMPMLKLWNDEPMKAFREKLVSKFRSDVLTPVETQLGIKLADYQALLNGQFTIAIVQNGWEGTTEKIPALLVIMDARDKGDQLKSNLADLKKKLTDSGKSTRAEKIREVEFDVISLDLAEMADKKGDKSIPKLDIFVGRLDSVLLIGTSGPALEKVLAHQAGGTAASLAEVPAFEADAKLLFRDADQFGWIHFAPIAKVISKLATEASQGSDSNPMTPKPDKILSALGLLEIKSFAAVGRQNAEGGSADMYIGAPADKRKGLLKMFASEAKPSAPPPFVPADAIEFTRWRLDGQKVWAGIESLINEVAPGVMGFVMGQMESSLKEKDPNFDFRKNLIGNLGDDIITYKKAPRDTKPEDLANQLTLTLVASSKPEAHIQAFKTLLLIAPPPISTTEMKEREFLGRKIYSLPIPAEEGERTISFCASGGYLAIATDTAILEEYLRSGESKAKPLAELPGLNEAAAKVGGTSTGLFTYQNDSESMRLALDMIKNHGGLLEQGLAQVLAENAGAEEVLKKMKEWIDISLLPPWDKISKYFSFTVVAGRIDDNGYRLSVFTPMPAGAK